MPTRAEWVQGTDLCLPHGDQGVSIPFVYSTIAFLSNINVSFPWFETRPYSHTCRKQLLADRVIYRLELPR